jgi:pullulanase, type I
MKINTQKRPYPFLFVIAACFVALQTVSARASQSSVFSSELIYSPSASCFSLWAPTAEKVRLNLYAEGMGGDAFKVVPMKKASDGFWTVKVNSNLDGRFYTYQIFYKGAWLKETPGIFAKAVGVNGRRAAVINLRTTDPLDWKSDVRPALAHFTDIVVYEMHHRDFSVASNSGMLHKGKYLALTEHGTVNDYGQATGIDHLRDLGITHVHLLPSYDYGSVDETRLNDNKYNWGYDPVNYNVPEGSYSTNPYDPASRIREFKQMVQSLHKSGIRVIMDVVYNHTLNNDDSNFSLTAPGYFYRYNPDGSYSNASGCNNETASEKERMRQFMIESVKYWVTEYHVDGFRFDLMGIHDIETMNQIRRELDKIDPTLFMYGEGWTAGNSTLPEEFRAVKKNGLQMLGIALFSDDLRDGVKGHFSDHRAAGFAGGKAGLEESVKFGIAGASFHPQVNYAKVNYSNAPYANNPAEVINYVSCHDDMCLNDKLKASSSEKISPEELQRRNKLAQTIVFTAQGVPFMLAGEELYRNKKGVANSYQSPDSINQLDWNNKTLYADIYEYYKGLIALRKAHPAFWMDKTAMMQEDLTFLDIQRSCVVGFLLNNHANGDVWDKILVIHNGNEEPVEVEIPDGEWTSVVSDGTIDIKGIKKYSGKKVVVAPVSSFIAYK